MAVKKYISAMLVALALAGCGDQVKSEYSVGTVVQEYEESSKWGCIGSNWNTVVRFDDGRMKKVCGRYGGVGAKVGMCYLSGHFDRSNDGWRMECNPQDSLKKE